MKKIKMYWLHLILWFEIRKLLAFFKSGSYWVGFGMEFYYSEIQGKTGWTLEKTKRILEITKYFKYHDFIGLPNDLHRP